MRYSILAPSSGSEFQLIESSPWNKFFEEMSRNGFELVSLSQDPDIVIFNNVSWNNIGKVFKFRSKSKVLIVWESAVTSPLSHKILIRKQFDLTFISSGSWRCAAQELEFVWPQSTETPVEKSLRKRKNRVAFVARNNISFAKNENYSFRREIVFKSNLPLDVFGHDWNRSATRSLFLVLKNMLTQALSGSKISLKGARLSLAKRLEPTEVVDNKIKKLADYRFSLVIENSSDYVSEKIVDSIIAGCVPIYVGPPLLNFGFPPKIAILSEPSLDGILESLVRLQSDEAICQEIVNNGKSFISSVEFSREFANVAVLKKLASTISLKLKS